MRKIVILSLVLFMFSCTWWKAEEHGPPETVESPVITSLKDPSLPCFGCHSYEKFSADEAGQFSHPKHMGFGVHCNQCHIIEPHEKISLNREVCDRCHKMTTFTFTGSPMPVNFSHKTHAGMFGCNECHPSPFQMKKGSSSMTMQDLYKGKYCGKCHNGTMAFSSKDCSKCHDMSPMKKDFKYASGDMAPAVFSHTLHTSMFDCDYCHTSIFKYKKGGSGMTMDAIYQNKYCGKCHDGQTAFGSTECQRCHQ